jgi:lipopolysaccharide/colanic/teichoic acid biosynthesis glycosyltransferase
VLKSATDKALAALLLVVSSPVFLASFAVLGVDMLLVPEDRGPLLYRERRVSRGREFDLFKLRTLRADVLDALEPDDYVRLAEAEPDNLTRAGRTLKRFYLDELPQLVNILRGDMSLVGPRPWPPAMVREQVAAGRGYRNHVQAGWTGPAQVTKGGSDPVSYAELDLGYVEGCRTWGAVRLVRYDLGILVRTVGVVVRGQGLRF